MAKAVKHVVKHCNKAIPIRGYSHSLGCINAIYVCKIHIAHLAPQFSIVP